MRGFLNGMRHVLALCTSKGPPPPHFVVRCRFMFSYCGGAPVSNDSVTKLSQLPHETRRLSHGPVDGVVAAWHRIDAIDANLKFRKLQKQTLSQHLREGKIPIIIAARF